MTLDQIPINDWHKLLQQNQIKIIIISLIDGLWVIDIVAKVML